MNNSLLTIKPYKVGRSVWVFDDAAVGLRAEAFVGDINKMIDNMVFDADIRSPERGFLATFSAIPFKGYQMELNRIKRDAGHGTDYYCPTYDMEGWLCPALFKYFPTAPDRIYVRADALRRETVFTPCVDWARRFFR